jgi:alkanesulfonate monooxygenase SsuD/methylene tetrahydromethanopterin reductase-like flavin-dependent oxidoreductase (luciferase family)
MKVGVLLPTFRDTASDALAVAEQAYASGLDGVFAYDHLYPMGQPERPALAPFPVLAALAERIPTLDIGPLVARVGLGAPDTLIANFRALHALAPGRVIAAVGTGDKLSAAENEAYGLAYPDATTRRAQLREVASALVGTMTVWVGAGAAATNELAGELGATLNVWQRDVADLPGESVTWAGRFADDIQGHLDALRDAGVTYAVGVPWSPIDEIAAWRARNR